MARTPFKMKGFPQHAGVSPMKKLGVFDWEGNRISTEEGDRREKEGEKIIWTNEDAIEKNKRKAKEAREKGDEKAAKTWDREAELTKKVHEERLKSNRKVTGTDFDDDKDRVDYKTATKIDKERQEAVDKGKGGKKTKAPRIRSPRQDRDIYTDKEIEKKEKIVDAAKKTKGGVTRGLVDDTKKKIKKGKEKEKEGYEGY